MIAESIQISKDSYIRFRTTKSRKRAAKMLADKMGKDSYIRFRTTKSRKRAAKMLADKMGKTLTDMYECWLDEKLAQSGLKQPIEASKAQ
jgi:antitoxin component of RelBE/YafQ-DinJ toxin-antitoxin module